MRFISHHEIEWGLICDGVMAVIVGKFSVGDFICPRTGVGSAEDLEVHFDLLIDTLCFTVGLGVIDSGKGEIVVEEFAKLLDEGRGELWATIRDNFVIKPEVKVYIVKKEASHSFSSDRFLSGAENYPLSKAMVDHDQQRVKARGGREVSDKVTGDLLEGPGGL